jgi:hypothetical protein
MFSFLFKVGFVISWTPYAGVSLYTAFIDEKGVDETVTIIPSVFAKLSLIWSSFAYIFTNRSIKLKIRKLHKKLSMRAECNKSAENEEHAFHDGLSMARKTVKD